MIQSPPYSQHHPRWHRRRVSTYWWAGRASYFAFIVRELSSVFIAWFVVDLLLLVRALRLGDAAYQRFLAQSAHPALVTLNVVTLALVLFHAITWFNLAPQAMVVKVAGRRVPGVLIAGSNYAAWGFVSAVLVWLLIGA
jgi:succinate dehydrogenase subunit C